MDVDSRNSHGLYLAHLGLGCLFVLLGQPQDWGIPVYGRGWLHCCDPVDFSGQHFCVAVVLRSCFFLGSTIAYDFGLASVVLV